MKDHPLTQAALLVVIVSAGIILEKWLITALPDHPILLPLKKVVSII